MGKNSFFLDENDEERDAKFIDTTDGTYYMPGFYIPGNDAWHYWKRGEGYAAQLGTTPRYENEYGRHWGVCIEERESAKHIVVMTKDQALAVYHLICDMEDSATRKTSPDIDDPLPPAA